MNNDVTSIVLHGSADATKVAVSVTAYTLAFHVTSPVQRNLLVAKSRIAPRDLSIPWLELIAAHMLSRLMNHAKEVLKDQPIDNYHCWVDSTTVLYWIKGQGIWSQFVRNRTTPFKRKGTYSGTMYRLMRTPATKEAEEFSPETWVACGSRDQSG